MTWLWWAMPLILLVFLWTLNEFLRGRLKEATSVVLAILVFAMIAVAFAVSGWRFGVGALVAVLVLVNLLRPAGLAVARRLIRYPNLGFERSNRGQPTRTRGDFGSDRYFKRREKEEQEQARHKSETVSTATKSPVVAEVLARLNATEQDLVAFYDRIEVHSLPPRARETVLHNARLVAFFLENSEPYQVYDGVYSRKVSMDIAIRLQLGTHSNPGGEEPNPRQ